MPILPRSENGKKATAMVLWATIIMVTGYSFMRFTTPDQDQLYNQLSPELRRQFDRERAATRKLNDERLERMFKESKLDRPAWMTQPATKDDK